MSNDMNIAGGSSTPTPSSSAQAAGKKPADTSVTQVVSQMLSNPNPSKQPSPPPPVILHVSPQPAKPQSRSPQPADLHPPDTQFQTHFDNIKKLYNVKSSFASFWNPPSDKDSSSSTTKDSVSNFNPYHNFTSINLEFQKMKALSSQLGPDYQELDKQIEEAVKATDPEKKSVFSFIKATEAIEKEIDKITKTAAEKRLAPKPQSPQPAAPTSRSPQPAAPTSRSPQPAAPTSLSPQPAAPPSRSPQPASQSPQPVKSESAPAVGPVFRPSQETIDKLTIHINNAEEIFKREKGPWYTSMDESIRILEDLKKELIEMQKWCNNLPKINLFIQYALEFADKGEKTSYDDDCQIREKLGNLKEMIGQLEKIVSSPQSTATKVVPPEAPPQPISRPSKGALLQLNNYVNEVERLLNEIKPNEETASIMSGVQTTLFLMKVLNINSHEINNQIERMLSLNSVVNHRMTNSLDLSEISLMLENLQQIVHQTPTSETTLSEDQALTQLIKDLEELDKFDEAEAETRNRGDAAGRNLIGELIEQSRARYNLIKIMFDHLPPSSSSQYPQLHEMIEKISAPYAMLLTAVFSPSFSKLSGFEISQKYYNDAQFNTSKEQINKIYQFLEKENKIRYYAPISQEDQQMVMDEYEKLKGSCSFMLVLQGDWNKDKKRYDLKFVGVKPNETIREKIKENGEESLLTVFSLNKLFQGQLANIQKIWEGGFQGG